MNLGKSSLWYAVAVFVGFLVGFFSRPMQVVTKETVKYDTTIYYEPKPLSTNIEPRVFNVPKLVFAPSETRIDTLIRVDSVKVLLAVEEREYRDSSYRAIVSGPVVGDCRPELKHFEVYQKEVVKSVIQRPPLFSPIVAAHFGNGMIGASGGVSIRHKYDVFATIWQVDGENRLTLGMAYRF